MAWSEHIHIHLHNEDNKAILAELTIIKNQNLQIMSAIDDLKAQVATLKTQVSDLQTSVDNEQAQIQALLDSNAAVVTDLNNQIAALNAAIAAGATPEQLAEVAASLTEVSDSIVTTKGDIEGTVQP